MFAWESSDKGLNTHMQSDPTKLHFLMKQFAQRKTDMTDQKKRQVLDKYGGEEHFEAPARELLLRQSVCGLTIILFVLVRYVVGIRIT